MARSRETAADYIERHDAEMRIILGELAEHAGRINTWWTFARNAVRDDPERALELLVKAETYLDTHVRVERSDALRRIRSAMSRLDEELPDRDDADAFNRAWIFLSIGDALGCQGPVSRNALVAAADAINHALPTDAELDQALAALTELGLVAIAGDDVGLTAIGCERYAAANDRYGRRGHVERTFALAEEWASGSPGVR